MSSADPARPSPRRFPRTLARALLVVVVAIVVARGFESLATQAPAEVRRGEDRVALGEPGRAPAHAREHRGGDRAGSGAAPNGATVFDEDLEAIANLDPALLAVLRQAASDAAAQGVEFRVNSGWRSAEYQAQLLREAVLEYGSEAEAARWVATPETSSHVSGDAVDLGPAEATAWLSAHGAAYGLCQTYRNEPWHYELRPEAPEGGCPPPYADPTHDPRMHR